MPKQNKKTESRPKKLYGVKNWSKYDKALVQRGSITFWMSEDFEKTWLYVGEKQRGSQFEYSDQAIVVMVTVKEVFHRTNRGAEGFIRSMFQLIVLISCGIGRKNRAGRQARGVPGLIGIVDGTVVADTTPPSAIMFGGHPCLSLMPARRRAAAYREPR